MSGWGGEAPAVWARPLSEAEGALAWPAAHPTRAALLAARRALGDLTAQERALLKAFLFLRSKGQVCGVGGGVGGGRVRLAE